MYGGFSPSYKKNVSAEHLLANSGTYTWNNFNPIGNFVRITAGTHTFNSILGRDSEITFYNQGGTVTFTNNSGGVTTFQPNRIMFPDSASFALPSGRSITFKWSALRGWVPSHDYLKVGTPLFFNNYTIAIQQSSTSTNGFLSSGDWNTFYSKLGVTSLNLDGLTYVASISPNTVSSSSTLSWNSTNERLGVGVTSANSRAALHTYANGGTVADDIDAPVIVTKEGFTPLGNVTGSTVGATTPSLSSGYAVSAVPNYGGTGYTANGDTITYRITTYYNDGSNDIAAATSNQGSSVDDGSTNPYSVDVSWSLGASLETMAGVLVERDVNGGGFVDYVTLAGGTTSWSDDNTSWTNGSYSFGGTADDFVANNSTYSFSVVSFDTCPTPSSTYIYSPSADNPSYTDSNDGTTFKMTITNGTGPNTNFKWIIGGNSVDASGFSSLDISPSSLGGGDNISTPSIVGYLSDGSVLNRDYYAHGRNEAFGNACYSGGTLGSVVDYNDGNYYYVTIQFSSTEYGFKLTRDINGAGVVDAVEETTSGSQTWTIYDDNVNPWAASPSLSPAVIVDPAYAYEAQGTSDSSPPSGILKSIDGSYFREEWRSNADVVVGTHGMTTDGLNATGFHFITFNSKAAATVPNNSLFRDSATGKLSYKDNSGTTNALY